MMTTNTSMFPVRLLLLAISLVVSLAVLVNWFSSLLTYSSSVAGLAVEPLNSEARVSILTASLADKNADIDPALRLMAINGATLEPADARYVSILGLMQDAEGDRQEAQSYYQAALTILPVEIQALSRHFLWQVENGKYREAVKTADIIYRRWPQYLEVVSDQLPYILSNKEGYEEVISVFGSFQDGPTWLVNTLSGDPNAALVVNRVLLDLNATGHNDLRPAINRLTSRFIRSGNSGSAYQLFLNTLNETEEMENGYIFNGDFNLVPNGNPFDWRLRNQSGMDFSIVDVISDLGAESDRALQVRFLDSPVRFDSALLLMRLPPSNFTLTIDYSTRSLRGPKPVRLIIDCLAGRHKTSKLLSVEFAIGGSSDQVVGTDFTVPQTNCDLQRIRLVNDNFVESWRNRYSGSLLLKSVTLTRTQ